eukprot:s1976_g9.t1
MTLFGEVFRVAQGEQRAAGKAQQVVRQSRRLAQELVLGSVLAPACVSNLTARTLPRVFATDASLGRGAACSAPIPWTTARVLWLNADRRGAYSRLDTGPAELLHALGLPCASEDLGEAPASLPRQVPFRFDVLLLGRASPAFVAAASSLGLQVPESGREKDGASRTLNGLTAADPYCLASWARLAHCLPDPWHKLLSTGLARSWVLDRCQYGCVDGGKLVCLASRHIRGDLFRRSAEKQQARGGGPTVCDPLPPGLAEETAKVFRAAALAASPPEQPPGIESPLCNDVLCSAEWTVDFVVPWRGKSHINTLERGSIGILERKIALTEPGSRFTVLVDSTVAKAASAKGRSTSLALQPGLRRSMAHQIAFDLYPAYGFAPTRLNVADDPTRCVDLREAAPFSLHRCLPQPVLHNLGRLRLRRPLASWVRLALVVLGAWAGLSESCLFHLAGRFAPLLGPGPLPPQLDFDAALGFPGEGPLCATEFASKRHLGDFSFDLGSPFILPLSPQGLRVPCWAVLPPVGSLRVEPFACHLPPSGSTTRFCTLSFDSTLGFPGEGWGCLFRVFLFWALLLHAMAIPAPLTPADAERATRRADLLIVADRVVRPVTRSNRAKLAEAFGVWLESQQGRTLKELLEVPFDQAEQIGEALTAYGQFLFRTGQAYYKFSETINSIASLRPPIRRCLTRPWDLAFAWLTEEPPTHHQAMPKGVLLAVLSVALLWGWATEAAVIALTWAGLLRIGETLAATRKDLVLPDDAAPGTCHILLQIKQPKTRGRAARHQAARIDPIDVVSLVSTVLGSLPSAAKLWPFSDGVLRRRLRAILLRLGLHEKGTPVFDLASLRPGGATWMLQATENAELVRRRGRWLSGRVMEIYLQEVVAVTFLPRLPPTTRASVEQLAADFPWILQRALFFERSSIPRRTWYFLFAGQPTSSSMGGVGKIKN